MVGEVSYMNKSQVDEKVESAINKLIEKDSHLLIIDVNERSISHRLALYLQEQFDDWDVDCEYNRNTDQTKMLNIKKQIQTTVNEIQADDTEGKTVFPDIIVHIRGTNDNLLVIEMKKSSSSVSKDFDIKKLEAFADQLGYKYRLFLCFNTGSECLKDPEKEWV